MSGKSIFDEFLVGLTKRTVENNTGACMETGDSTTTHRSELGQTYIVYVGTLLASLKNSKEVNALRTNFCVFALAGFVAQTIKQLSD